MSKEILSASAAFGLFVVCPRMAGMMHVINKNSNVSMLWTVLLGMAFSLPLMLLMVFTFNKIGVWGALGVCVLTDFAAALIMKNISINAAIETLIIALFVIAGVKIAPLVTGLFSAK